MGESSPFAPFPTHLTVRRTAVHPGIHLLMSPWWFIQSWSGTSFANNEQHSAGKKCCVPVLSHTKSPWGDVLGWRIDPICIWVERKGYKDRWPVGCCTLVIVNTECQLGNKALGTSVKQFLDRVKWGMKTQLNWKWYHSIYWSPRLRTKDKMF